MQCCNDPTSPAAQYQDMFVICLQTNRCSHFQKPENSKDVKIGTLIAVMVEEGDDWQNAEIPAEEVDAAAPTAAVTEAEASPSPASKAAPTSPLAHGTELYGDG